MKIYGINYIYVGDNRYITRNYFSDACYKDKNKAIKKLLRENLYDSRESAEDYTIYQSFENENVYGKNQRSLFNRRRRLKY